ncbi:MAG: UDP-3-O-acyl-N-acetylglucosamine deacetylase [Cyanobacteria bacterium]|nr:UDP-3-O-acyl-N-acetylglucosamine deacetylase [Cyanobacteriota bacterium]
MSPLPNAATSKTLSVSGSGLISGKSVTVTITPQSDSGIRFYVGDQEVLASLKSVVHTDRGVTLANTQMPASVKPFTLSIVEHFLAACSLYGLHHATVSVSWSKNQDQELSHIELPLLDGSAQAWITHFEALWGPLSLVSTQQVLRQPVVYSGGRDHSDIHLVAVPAERFQIRYGVNFPHPDLFQRWEAWDYQQDGIETLAPAQTFGFVNELPELQARGLAKGVTHENTLGLIEDGGYTRPLLFPGEPIRHKMLDLIGDLTLMEINPLSVGMQVIAFNAGHTSHIALARLLQPLLRD